MEILLIFLFVSVAISIAMGQFLRHRRYVWHRDCPYILRSGRECEVVDVEHILHIAEGQR